MAISFFRVTAHMDYSDQFMLSALAYSYARLRSLPLLKELGEKGGVGE